MSNPLRSPVLEIGRFPGLHQNQSGAIGRGRDGTRRRYGMTAKPKTSVTVPARPVPNALIRRRRSAHGPRTRATPRAAAIEASVNIGHRLFALDDHHFACESLSTRCPDLKTVPDLPPCLTDASRPSEPPVAAVILQRAGSRHISGSARDDFGAWGNGCHRP
jgi:hypothetical protein